jgi:hypothetical protein
MHCTRPVFVLPVMYHYTVPPPLPQLSHVPHRLHHTKPWSVCDAYTRQTRLDTFFDGLACCSRRSAREAVSAMFRAVQQMSHSHTGNTTTTTITPNHPEPDSTDTPPPPEAVSTESQSPPPRISARRLVETGYRIGVALAYFQRPFEAPLGSRREPTLLEDPDSIQSLAQSLVEKSRRRSSRPAPSNGPNNNDDAAHNNDDNDDTIALEDVIKWCDSVAPYLEEALQIQRHLVSESCRGSPKHQGNESAIAAHQLELADTLFNIGGLCLEWMRRQGPDSRRADEAESVFQECLQLLTHVLGPAHPQTLQVKSLLGIAKTVPSSS